MRVTLMCFQSNLVVEHCWDSISSRTIFKHSNTLSQNMGMRQWSWLIEEREGRVCVGGGDDNSWCESVIRWWGCCLDWNHSLHYRKIQIEIASFWMGQADCFLLIRLHWPLWSGVTHLWGPRFSILNILQKGVIRTSVKWQEKKHPLLWSSI